MPELSLNVADAFAPSRVNGPGSRAVVHVQGCSLRCAGCHNPEMWAPKARRLLLVRQLVAWYRSLRGLRGLTLSGGEPFEQALALGALADAVHAAGGDVVVFSGYRLEELRAGTVTHAERLLNAVDLLIDDRYRADLPTRAPLRGSENQRLHFLTDRIQPEEVTDLPHVELVSAGGTAVLSGFGITAWAQRGTARD